MMSCILGLRIYCPQLPFTISVSFSAIFPFRITLLMPSGASWGSANVALSAIFCGSKIVMSASYPSSR